MGRRDMLLPCMQHGQCIEGQNRSLGHGRTDGGNERIRVVLLLRCLRGRGCTATSLATNETETPEVKSSWTIEPETPDVRSSRNTGLGWADGTWSAGSAGLNETSGEGTVLDGTTCTGTWLKGDWTADWCWCPRQPCPPPWPPQIPENLARQVPSKDCNRAGVNQERLHASDVMSDTDAPKLASNSKGPCNEPLLWSLYHYLTSHVKMTSEANTLVHSVVKLLTALTARSSVDRFETWRLYFS